MAIWQMLGASMGFGSIVMTDPNWSVTNVGDFNGDGKADLVWKNGSTGDSAVWIMNGASFVSGATLLPGPTPWSVANPR